MNKMNDIIYQKLKKKRKYTGFILVHSVSLSLSIIVIGRLHKWTPFTTFCVYYFFIGLTVYFIYAFFMIHNDKKEKRMLEKNKQTNVGE